VIFIIHIPYRTRDRRLSHLTLRVERNENQNSVYDKLNIKLAIELIGFRNTDELVISLQYLLEFFIIIMEERGGVRYK